MLRIHAFCWFWKYPDPFCHDENLKILVCFVFCRCLLKTRSWTPMRSHFHRAQSHPHPPLQLSCGWLHEEAISPITRALVNSGHWDQSQHFTVSLKVGSHKVSVPLRRLQQPHWSQMKKTYRAASKHLTQIRSQQIFMEKRVHRHLQVKPVT